ncbi:hypothetical protein ACFQBQ_11600 [Granulicella cerasi]|uniref:Peptidase S54 rhomboid domain-containing protein n=1 Tax=Granulicella cerasi TaxID=741063 RepID=A0ABW1ZBD3_9BACT|nr:hypothetical protein [Granulicella cerasi]
MASNTIPFALPPFRGLVKRIVLAALAVWAVTFALSLISSEMAGLVYAKFGLVPQDFCSGLLWQPLTYPLVSVKQDIFGLLLSLLSFWFFGSALESERGIRWFGEFIVFSSVTGSVVAAVLSRLAFENSPSLRPSMVVLGLGPLNILLLLAFARMHPEDELVFNFILRMRAKYLAAIFILIYVASAMTTGHRLDLLVAVCVSLAGLAFLRFAPYFGFRLHISERYYRIRNAQQIRKRRRAAKKFKVYMNQQGKDVSIDSSGRYIKPEEERRDPNDRSWMN